MRRTGGCDCSTKPMLSSFSEPGHLISLPSCDHALFRQTQFKRLLQQRPPSAPAPLAEAPSRRCSWQLPPCRPPAVVCRLRRTPSTYRGGFPDIPAGDDARLAWTLKAAHAGAVCRATSEEASEWMGERPPCLEIAGPYHRAMGGRRAAGPKERWRRRWRLEIASRAIA